MEDEQSQVEVWDLYRLFFSLSYKAGEFCLFACHFAFKRDAVDLKLRRHPFQSFHAQRSCDTLRFLMLCRPLASNKRVTGKVIWILELKMLPQIKKL